VTSSKRAYALFALGCALMAGAIGFYAGYAVEAGECRAFVRDLRNAEIARLRTALDDRLTDTPRSPSPRNRWSLPRSPP